jgi:ABC-type multidrug transport system ATPase subunit
MFYLFVMRIEGLTHCAEAAIGGGLMKGISGGEKKRTSVGVELVCKPSLVFLDEPTSGLVSLLARRTIPTKLLV